MAIKVDTQKRSDLKRRSIYFSLRWKLLLGFTLIFSVVFAVAFYWFYQFATNAALNRIQDDLTSTLSGAAAGVNTDELLAVAHESQPNAAGQAWQAVSNASDDATAASLAKDAIKAYGQAIPGGFSDDPRYQHQLNWLDTIHKIEPRAWPYIYIPGSQPAEIIYVVDLWARYDASRASSFMYVHKSKGFSLSGLEHMTLRTASGCLGIFYSGKCYGTTSNLFDLNPDQFSTYTDSYGSWVSAYTPIKDPAGHAVGAMGIDFEAAYVDQVRQSILNSVFAAFLITYTSLFVLVFLFSGALTNPIVKLTQAANALGEGDYSQDFSKLRPVGRFSDEIEKLADVFTVMADKVRQREQTLKRQVEALKIEIDETKRKKQVSEIADSDFFRDLQTKARQMRSGHEDQ
jgi:HAMP domain-containing protein